MRSWFVVILVGCGGAPAVSSSPTVPTTPAPTLGTVTCTTTVLYTDADGDGFGDPATAENVCEGTAAGRVPIAGDCDDTEPLAWDGAEDLPCDGVDNDCDGVLPQCTRPLLDGAATLIEDALATAGFVGDVDGDGFDDLAVQSDAGNGTEVTRVVSGASLPGASGPVAALSTATLVDTPGLQRQGVFPAGDTDGDGLDDFWVAAPLRRVAGGVAGPVDLAAADVTIAFGTFFGPMSAFTGDVDGDGIPDVLASDAHETFLFRGPFPVGTTAVEDAALHVVTTDEHTASLTVDAADIDGDGLPEALVGADCEDGYGGVGGPSEDLMAGAVSGTQSGTLATSDRAAFTFAVECSAALTHGSARFVGDVNGDGHVDLGIVGASDLFVVAGPLVGAVDPLVGAMLTLSFVSPDRPVGAVHPVGDLDGDGADDLALLTVGPALQATVHVVRGGRTGALGVADTDAVWTGGPTDQAFGGGMALSSSGDADGDGLVDLLVTSVSGDLYYLTGASPP